MKRYDMVPRTVCGDPWQDLEEREDGDWVYWEDAQAEIERLQDMIYKARVAVLNEDFDADDVLRILGWKEDDKP